MFSLRKSPVGFVCVVQADPGAGRKLCFDKQKTLRSFLSNSIPD